jgi:hypothetical protein
MKKSLLVSAFALLATAVVSQAAVMVSVTKTGTSGGDDFYNVNISALTGADANAGTLGQLPGVISLTGTLSSTAGTLITNGTTANYKTNLTNGGSVVDTYFNFDTVLSAQTSRTPNTNSPTSLTGVFSDLNGQDYQLTPTEGANAANNGFDQTLLAQIVMTAGGSSSFSGQIGTQGGGVSNFSFVVPAPEPASLSLLGLGALGFARRRRA